MPVLKGEVIGGYINVTRNVKFSGAVLAGRLSPSPWSTVYYVDGISGQTTNDGLSPGKAFSTIQAALTLGGRGTVIYVRPQTYKIGTGFNRYVEDLTLALGGAGGSAVVATNSDISLIGVTQSLNPEYGVRLKATTIGLQSDAPSLHVENIGWYAEDATYAVYIRCNGATYTQRGADGTTFYNCVIKGSGIYVKDGGDGLSIDKCVFHTKYDGTSGGIGAIKYVCSNYPGARFRVMDSRFYGGNVTEAPATCYITVLPPMTQMTIAHNIFGTIPTDGHMINLAGSDNTGIVADNFFAHANLTLETHLHIGGCVQVGNRDTAGLLV